MNGAKICDVLESAAPPSRVVATRCEALLLLGQASSGLRSRGPGVRLPPGAPAEQGGNQGDLEVAPEALRATSEPRAALMQQISRAWAGDRSARAGSRERGAHRFR